MPVWTVETQYMQDYGHVDFTPLFVKPKKCRDCNVYAFTVCLPMSIDVSGNALYENGERLETVIDTHMQRLTIEYDIDTFRDFPLSQPRVKL